MITTASAGASASLGAERDQRHLAADAGADASGRCALCWGAEGPDYLDRIVGASPRLLACPSGAEPFSSSEQVDQRADVPRDDGLTSSTCSAW
ncbi:MAG: hypothetical protein R3F43_06000 [bacterium]